MTVTRRKAIETIGKTTAVAAVAAPVVANATPVDPHPAWLERLAELKRQRQEMWKAGVDDEGPEITRNYAENDELELCIQQTTAHTYEGIDARLRWLRDDTRNFAENWRADVVEDVRLAIAALGEAT